MRGLQRTIIKEEPRQPMTWQDIGRWASIPTYSENDPLHPEWIATPVHFLDLTSDGYGAVLVKDESVNPGGNHKARPAWEVAALVRDAAQIYERKHHAGTLNGNLADQPGIQFSLMTAGNFGTQLCRVAEEFGLPRPNLLVDVNINPEALERLKKRDVNIYMTDLGRRPYSGEEILWLTNNPNGIELTSTRAYQPQVIFYDWLSHEIFKEGASKVFGPYGSGGLFENLLTHQVLNARNRDPRLDSSISLEQLAEMSIMGAAPLSPHSIADKLTASFNPFAMYGTHDIKALKALGFTGRHTGVYKVPDEKLLQATAYVSRVCNSTEPSGSAGLALYLMLWEKGKICQDERCLVVNTGSGH